MNPMTHARYSSAAWQECLELARHLSLLEDTLKQLRSVTECHESKHAAQSLPDRVATPRGAIDHGMRFIGHAVCGRFRHETQRLRHQHRAALTRWLHGANNAQNTKGLAATLQLDLSDWLQAAAWIRTHQQSCPLHAPNRTTRIEEHLAAEALKPEENRRTHHAANNAHAPAQYLPSPHL